MSPLANSYLKPCQLHQKEIFFPLCVRVCASCFLVQLEPAAMPEDIFSEYAYFSSYSDSWLDHVKSYVDSVIGRFGLNQDSRVIEIASNDGYLLQYFVQKDIPVLGIEPAKNVAAAAVKKGIPTLVRFFGEQAGRDLAAEGKQGDLLIGNNVLAHVPDLTGFIKGLKTLLAKKGVITLECPHLLRLIAENQFDTIYHEHLSYFSILTIQNLFARFGLTVFDVEELPTHGGSLRIYACHEEDWSKCISAAVSEVVAKEKAAGLNSLEGYLSFSERIQKTKRNLLHFLIQAKKKGKSVAAYGAPAKGNTLLNYCGIRTDFIDYTVDRSPHKQDHLLPGSRIPICHPDRIKETRPNYLLILPWNLKEEIMGQMSYIGDWGGRFIIPIPEVTVL
jgi:SAM-dependent methyltransferase